MSFQEIAALGARADGKKGGGRRHLADKELARRSLLRERARQSLIEARARRLRLVPGNQDLESFSRIYGESTCI